MRESKSIEENLEAIFDFLGEMAEEVAEFVEEFEDSGGNPARLPPNFRVKGYGELYELSVAQIAAYLFKHRPGFGTAWFELLKVTMRMLRYCE